MNIRLILLAGIVFSSEKLFCSDISSEIKKKDAQSVQVRLKETCIKIVSELKEVCGGSIKNYFVDKKKLKTNADHRLNTKKIVFFGNEMHTASMNTESLYVGYHCVLNKVLDYGELEYITLGFIMCHNDQKVVVPIQISMREQNYNISVSYDGAWGPEEISIHFEDYIKKLSSHLLNDNCL